MSVRLARVLMCVTRGLKASCRRKLVQGKARKKASRVCVCVRACVRACVLTEIKKALDQEV
jgi:hypothetical protein